jgi:hypothetical protein
MSIHFIANGIWAQEIRLQTDFKSMDMKIDTLVGVNNFPKTQMFKNPIDIMGLYMYHSAHI